MYAQPPSQLFCGEREIPFHQLRAAAFERAFQPPGVVGLDTFDCEYFANYPLWPLRGETIPVFAPYVGFAAQVQPCQPRFLQRHIGYHEPPVTIRFERPRVRGCAGLGGRCRERAASEGGRGNAGARAVGIDDDLLAFVAQRYGLYAGAGEVP